MACEIALKLLKRFRSNRSWVTACAELRRSRKGLGGRFRTEFVWAPKRMWYKTTTYQLDSHFWLLPAGLWPLTSDSWILLRDLCEWRISPSSATQRSVRRSVWFWEVRATDRMRICFFNPICTKLKLQAFRGILHPVVKWMLEGCERGCSWKERSGQNNVVFVNAIIQHCHHSQAKLYHYTYSTFTFIVSKQFNLDLEIRQIKAITLAPIMEHSCISGREWSCSFVKTDSVQFNTNLTVKQHFLKCWVQHMEALQVVCDKQKEILFY